MSKKLLDSSSSSEDEEEPTQELKINEGFAQAFNRYREKEEYQKLKNKYGEEVANARLNRNDDEDDDSSSSDEEEDEEGKDWTEDHEKDFFKTLASLKRKDSKLYDGQTSFFSEVEKQYRGSTSQTKTSKDKPMTLIDLERQVITEKGGEFDELEDENLKGQMRDKTYVQELAEIKSSLTKATAESDESDSDEDGFLTKKEKSNEEVKKDEEDYRSWLSGQKDSLKDEDTEKDLKSLREFWNDDKLDDGEKFLRDYILNQGYLDKDENSDNSGNDGEDLSDDEKTLEQQAEFEHKYNFRFEEPDKDFIKRYPRTIEDSMRRKDDQRKKKRDEVKERKLKEKEKKREELKQLKAFKRKEILDKIEKLRKITGNDDLAFKDEDLEDDFDPDKYDERMKEVFDHYDSAPVNPEDEEKPVFSDMDSDLEFDNWDDYDGVHKDDEEDDDNDNVGNYEDGYDEEYQDDPQPGTSSKLETQKELIEKSKGRKKSKSKKSKFEEALESEKPTFDPEDKTFDQYLDEYYGLDYEDIIDDLPCRFKYRKVAANDLGLSTEEILSAPDRELNAWASLKKTCQYRSDAEEQKDIKEYLSKGKNVNLKKKILPSLFKEDPEDVDELQVKSMYHFVSLLFLFLYFNQFHVFAG